MKKLFIVFILITMSIFLTNITQVSAGTKQIIEGVYSPHVDSSDVSYNYEHVGYLYDYNSDTDKVKTYVDLIVYKKTDVEYEGVLGTIQVASYTLGNVFNGNYGSGLSELNNYYNESLTITKTVGVYLDFTINDLTLSYQFLEVGNYYQSTSSYKGNVEIDYSQVSNPDIIMTIYSLSAKVKEVRTVCTQERYWSWGYKYRPEVCEQDYTYRTYRLGYDEYFASVDVNYDLGSYLISNKNGYSYTYFY